MSSSWKTYEKETAKYLSEPKWIARGTIVTVCLDCADYPKKTKVAGKFGTRECYEVNTKESGIIYMNPAQFTRLMTLLKGDYTGKSITFTL